MAVGLCVSDDGASAALVGLWFSLGHSTVVVALCLLVAGGSSYARDHVDSLADVGGAVGGAVSAATLIVVGAVNLAGVGPTRSGVDLEDLHGVARVGQCLRQSVGAPAAASATGRVRIGSQ